MIAAHALVNVDEMFLCRAFFFLDLQIGAVIGLRQKNLREFISNRGGSRTFHFLFGTNGLHDSSSTLHRRRLLQLLFHRSRCLQLLFFTGVGDMGSRLLMESSGVMSAPESRATNATSDCSTSSAFPECSTSCSTS